MSDLFNEIIFAIKEARETDIDLFVENNVDYKNRLNDIKNAINDIEDEDVNKYKLLDMLQGLNHLVQDIVYIKGFQEGFKFYSELISFSEKDSISIVCPECKGKSMIDNPDFIDYWNKIQKIAGEYDISTKELEERIDNELSHSDGRDIILWINGDQVEFDLPVSRSEEIECPVCNGTGDILFSNFADFFVNYYKGGESE